MQRLNKADKVGAELLEKYGSRYYRKYKDRALVIQLMAHRTFNTASLVVGLIRGLQFADITRSVYIHCNDARFEPIAKAFGSQIELAGANEEKFLFGLHKFFNVITGKIRANGQYREIVDFLSAYLELQHNDQNKALNRNVVTAYSNLIMQTTEYLRPEKFNLSQALIGVTTDGEPMVGKALYPYFDLPGFQIQEELFFSKKPMSKDYFLSFMNREFKKQDITVNSMEDFEVLRGIQLIHENTTTSLLPYINEYTCDILPVNHYASRETVMDRLSLSIPAYAVQASLSQRCMTLPSNGVRVVASDRTGEIKEVLLKEMVKGDAVILLYRITTVNGDLSGYYNTQTDFFMSAFKDTSITDLDERVRALVLFLYAKCVTRHADRPDMKVYNGCGEVEFRLYNMGGKRRNQYEPGKNEHEPGASRRGNPDFEEKTAFLNGFIRKLPPGHKPSEQAVATAIKMGYALEPDETYVRPFSKTVFARADDETGKKSKEET